MSALRATDALLHSNGGFGVVLRLPGQAVSGSDAEQLGLTSPAYQEIPLGPAVWRKLGVRQELLISGTAVAQLTGSGQFASAESLWEQAVGVLVGGVFYLVRDAEPLTVNDVPCAYRVRVQAPVWS